MKQFESKYAAKKEAKRLAVMCKAADFDIHPVGARFFYPEFVTTAQWDVDFLTEKGHAVELRNNG